MTRKSRAPKALAGLGAVVLVLIGTLSFDLLFPWHVPRPKARPIEAEQLEHALELLPARNTGRGGKPGDPLNMAFVGTREQVEAALEEARWVPVPLRIPASVRAGLMQVLTGRTLTKFPPFNIYRLLDRRQDMNWAQVERPIISRHHFRLWRTGFVLEDGREVWWGSGNHDLSVRWRDLSHRPDPDMDPERDFVAAALEGSSLVESMRRVRLRQIPLRGANDKGYAFRTDGRALLVMLKP